MKPFLWDLVLPLLLVGPVSARSPAHVYLPQSYTSAGNSRFSSLSPSTARLILAQRLDIGDFHTVGTLDGWEGDSFNAFGARQQRLFEDKTESRPNAIVVISNVKDLEGICFPVTGIAVKLIILQRCICRLSSERLWAFICH